VLKSNPPAPTLAPEPFPALAIPVTKAMGLFALTATSARANVVEPIVPPTPTALTLLVPIPAGATLDMLEMESPAQVSQKKKKKMFSLQDLTPPESSC